jgi:hypothetical protein
MLQPFTLELFRPGFLVLLASSVLFMIVFHTAEPSSAAANGVVLEDTPPVLSEPIRPDNT